MPMNSSNSYDLHPQSLEVVGSESGHRAALVSKAVSGEHGGAEGRWGGTLAGALLAKVKAIA